MEEKLFDMSDADLTALQKAIETERIRRLAAEGCRYRQAITSIIQDALSKNLAVSIGNSEDEVWLSPGDSVFVSVF